MKTKPVIIRITLVLTALLMLTSVVRSDWVARAWAPTWTDPIEGVEGHLAEAGGSGTTSWWTYARYYGGEFYGGFPNRIMVGFTRGRTTAGVWESSYENYSQYASTPGTYVSTGRLWSSSAYTHGWSIVDTDYDSQVDGVFSGNPPEAFAFVTTTWPTVPTPPYP